jgi:hypothetical protein
MMPSCGGCHNIRPISMRMNNIGSQPTNQARNSVILLQVASRANDDGGNWHARLFQFRYERMSAGSARLDNRGDMRACSLPGCQHAYHTLEPALRCWGKHMENTRARLHGFRPKGVEAESSELIISVQNLARIAEEKAVWHDCSKARASGQGRLTPSNGALVCRLTIDVTQHLSNRRLTEKKLIVRCAGWIAEK